MKGMIGHIHLSDCDGKVHGDMPAGMGVTPIKEYLQAIIDTGYEGTVSIELEYAPEGRRSSPGRSVPTTERPRSCATSGARLTSIHQRSSSCDPARMAHSKRYSERCLTRSSHGL